MAKTTDSIVHPHGDKPMEEIIALTPLDQIMPRVYTRLILCIPMLSTSSENQATALASLKKGLSETLTQIPFLSDVLGDEEDGSGRVHIAPGSGVLLRGKDLTEDSHLAYQKLKDAAFPLSSLDGDVLAPVGMMSSEPAPPIMAAQANFVVGGLLLTVCLHHSALDAAGVATVVRTWAGNTKLSGDSKSGSETLDPLPSEALNRTPLINNSSSSKVDPNEKIKDFPQYKLTPPPPPPKADDPPPTFTLPPMTAAIFHFSASALAALKSAATPAPPTESYISTNDALCALLWHSITKARQLPTPTTSMLGFAIDGRKRLNPPLPPTYLGNVNIYASTQTTTDLPPTATQIRTAITSITPTHIQNLTTLISALPLVTALQPAFNSFLGPDLAITSWRDMRLAGLEWGSLIGKVESTRLPGAAFDGLCIVLPELEDGGLEVLIGLEDGAMGRLRGDEEFTKFARVSCV